MGVMCFSKSLHRRRPTSGSRRADSLLHRTRHAALSSAAGTARRNRPRCGARCKGPGRAGSQPHKGAVNSGANRGADGRPGAAMIAAARHVGTIVPELLLDVVVLVQVVDVHEIEDLLSKDIAGS